MAIPIYNSTKIAQRFLAHRHYQNKNNETTFMQWSIINPKA